MIFVFLDDTGLMVLRDIEAVIHEFEDWELRSGAYRVFDSRGLPLTPSHTPPPQTWLASLIAVTSPFVLTPSGTADLSAFFRALSSASYLDPNQYFQSLDEIRSHVLGIGQ